MGELADLIVLDRDFFKVEAEGIANVRVLQPVVGGRIVHDTGELRR